MPKCEKVLEKGKKKGQTCDIYTNKEINGKYYCSSHIKPLSNNSDSQKKEVTIKHQSNNFTLDFENCEQRINELDEIINDDNITLDKRIDATTEKIVLENRNKNKKTNVNYAQNMHILDKLEEINKRLTSLENQKNNDHEFEIYK